jgi:fatty-acyl-CoA synthase
MGTVAEYIRRNATSDRPALLFEDERYSHREVAQAAATRAAVLLDHRPPDPFHVGVLLDNVPEAIFWLQAAALVGATVVGINSTRRGAELARDIAHADCRLIVTDRVGMELLAGLDLGMPVWVVDSPEYQELLAPYDDVVLPDVEVHDDDRFVLIFTSGTTNAPKAACCSQGRMMGIGAGAVERMGITEDDVSYNAMPWFHSNALYVSFATWVASGGVLAMRRRFSASGFLPDVRKFGATYFNYVGKPLEYVLATPPTAQDTDNQLRFAIGNEANEHDIEAFSRRFGVKINDGFGSTEMGISISRTPDMPVGSLGRAPDDNTLVMDPATEEECPRARFDATGRLLNADEAIGEFVNKVGLQRFEGYYNNDEANAERRRNGWYWSGDLGYRDEEGFFYFAGRGYDWLRVDGENFSAAPIERILQRHPDVLLAAAYAVPDPHVGDQVMVALELKPGAVFDPAGFDAFLDGQADMGTKWLPRFVRVAESFPLTHTNKIKKRDLRREHWETADPIWWKPTRDAGYRPFTDSDAKELHATFEQAGRAQLLDAV